MFLIIIVALTILNMCCGSIVADINVAYNISINSSSSTQLTRRKNLDNVISKDEKECDKTIINNPGFQNYFDAMSNIYGLHNNKVAYTLGVEQANLESKTCLLKHKECGWSSSKIKNKLPTFVLSVGLEGAGHHLWTELLNTPVFDCVWTNARHYKRTIGDGVPRTTVTDLHSGFLEMLKFRTDKGLKPCTSIFDAEDSFPTGAIRKHGRVFNRPDIVNLQELDGILFNIKYLLIARNITDTALSALRRNFVTSVDAELRAVEHTLSYIESAIQQIPCEKIFVAHYEHVLEKPNDYIDPLSAFLELNPEQKIELRKRLNKSGKKVSRKPHKLTQYPDCQAAGLGDDVNTCYNAIKRLADNFFLKRSFMWPTFAGNGFNYKS
jgi:hypothetical protein